MGACYAVPADVRGNVYGGCGIDRIYKDRAPDLYGMYAFVRNPDGVSDDIYVHRKCKIFDHRGSDAKIHPAAAFDLYCTADLEIQSDDGGVSGGADRRFFSGVIYRGIVLLPIPESAYGNGEKKTKAGTIKYGKAEGCRIWNQCGSLEFFNKVSNMFTYSLNEFIPNSVKR